ncbi:DUF4419 domain-containing protein [Candidatus Kaiserbacteria bacterium]|nr:DUF4419 domain-containing protein [Candidatus Kaiserbacteria bacterium]
MLDVANSLTDNYGRNVSEKSPPTERLKVESFVQSVFPGQTIEHLGRTDMVQLARYGVTPSSLFFQTVYKAYADHHALGLRPDVLMYLINAVIAETVRRYPEDYRDLFTTKADKVDIHVRHDGLRLGEPTSPWDEAIDLFDQALRPHIPSRIMGQMLPEFTTATNESIVASLVAFMDAASPYYDYHTHTMCGIPRIVLFGEASDYRKLVVAATELAQSFQKHLAVYFANLLPVLETIAKTAETGRVDDDFWGQIYKQHEHSGSDRFSGWLTSFLWYVHKEDYRTKSNPLVIKDTELASWRQIEEGDGIDSGSEPSHVSRVPFTWHYFGTEIKMHFIGGILGVDTVEGALTPSLSYGVLQAN